MAVITAFDLKLCLKAIDIITTKTMDSGLMRCFVHQRQLLIANKHRFIESDKAEIILHSLDYHSLNELSCSEITDLMVSCIDYLRQKAEENDMNYFSFLLFESALEFAKWAEAMHSPHGSGTTLTILW